MFSLGAPVVLETKISIPDRPAFRNKKLAAGVVGSVKDIVAQVTCDQKLDNLKQSVIFPELSFKITFCFLSHIKHQRCFEIRRSL